MTTLRTGSKGAAVENLQVQLRRLGLYDGRVSGNFGASTAKAVKAYETSTGREIDGFVTAAEQKKLKADSLEVGARRGLQEGDSGTRVDDLKHDLQGLGFFNNERGAGFGDAMKLAVRGFERANGLTRRGCWSRVPLRRRRTVPRARSARQAAEVAKPGTASPTGRGCLGRAAEATPRRQASVRAVSLDAAENQALQRVGKTGTEWTGCQISWCAGGA